MAGTTSLNVVKVRRRFIAAKYKAAERDKRTKPPFSRSTHRVGELERIYRARYGRHLPDDDAGRDDLILAFNQIASYESCMEWASRWAPWLTRADAEALAERITAAPQWLKARPMGERLGLTDYERTALKIRTIRPIDVTDACLAERRKQKDRERKALRRQLARAAKPAPASHTKPWESEGVHRATWYRRRAKSVSQKRATKSVRNNSKSYTADGICRTTNLPKPVGLGPNDRSFSKSIKQEIGSGPATAGIKWMPKALSETWKPSGAGIAYAASQGVPPYAVGTEVQLFVEWHLARGKSPWPNAEKAWRSWCDRYLPYENERSALHEQRCARDRFFARMAA